MSCTKFRTHIVIIYYELIFYDSSLNGHLIGRVNKL